MSESSGPLPKSPTSAWVVSSGDGQLVGPALLDKLRLENPPQDGHGGDYMSTSMTGSVGDEYEEYIMEER